MAIKDQCMQCAYLHMGICKMKSERPNFDHMTCDLYEKDGINLEKTSTENMAITPDETIVQYTQNEEQRMFANPFSFSGRIRRAEYCLSYIFMYVYAIIIGLIDNEISGGEGGVIGLLIIPAWVFLFAQGAKRCHDRNNSGWYQIIPFYFLWMLFGDGDAYENDYGPDPKGRNKIS